MTAKTSPLPTASAARKKVPVTRGVLDYFPAALAAVAEVSRIGNEKHNPGEPMHHAREKSSDHADCVARHLMERGGWDEFDLPSGEHVRVRHSAEMAWRALALLQEEIEAAGEAPVARGAVPLPAQPVVNGPHEQSALRCAAPGCSASAAIGPYCLGHAVGSGG